MTPPKFLPYLVDIDILRGFSADGRLYRAFDHLIAARHGSLLMVPLIVLQGRFDGVVDGCPVPWEEVCAVLDNESLPFL